MGMIWAVSRHVRLLLVMVFAGLAAVSSAWAEEIVRFANPTGKPAALHARLHLPPGTGPFPAVVLIHGSSGVDARYAFHRKALLAAGIATFEADFKTGVFTSTRTRPKGEDFSRTFHPMTFAALKALRTRPDIIGDKIAVMGFSLGGNLALATSALGVSKNHLSRMERRFIAHVGFYPGCGRLGWLARQRLSAPVLILTGSKDGYGNGRDCPPLVAQLNMRTPGRHELHVYPGVHHGFDLQEETVTVRDPVADGGTARMEWNRAAAEDARTRAVAFLKKAMGL